MVEYLISSDTPLPANVLLAALQNHRTPQIIKNLVRNGAVVNTATQSGDTVLHLAVTEYSESTCLNLVKIFIAAGVNVTARNSQQKTIFDVAFEHDRNLVLEHLISSDVPLPADVLLVALLNGSTPQTIEDLVRNGAHVNPTTQGGDTVLHLAVARYSQSTCLDLVKIFIGAGVNATARNSQEKTIFHVAFEHGYDLVVEQLISSVVPLPADVLLVALQNSSTPMLIEDLVRNGADVNSTTQSGDTVLHLAVAGYSQFTCLDLVKTFIAAGVNVTARNSQQKTIFDVALEDDYTSVVEHLISSSVPLPADVLLVALQNRTTPQMIGDLIRNGADVNTTTQTGHTVLHLAFDSSNCIDETHLDLVNMLIEAGCDPTGCDSKGQTAFDVAVNRGYTSVIKHLLSSKVPLPSDVLLIALQERSTPKMIKLLVCKGANVHSTMSNGDTVLHLAVALYSQLACLSLVKIFVGAGVNATTRNSQEKTVFDAAFKCGYISVVEYLISCHVPLPGDILLVALQNRATPQIIKGLVHNGADVNSTTQTGDTALHLAFSNYSDETHLDLVNVFVEAGCDSASRNSEGKAAFDVAIKHGYTPVVKHLLSSKVPLPSNVLLIALRECSTPKVIELLLRKGANVHSTMPNGDTALHLTAAKYSASTRLYLIEKLIEGGCNPTIHDNKGETVLEVSIKHGYVSVVGYLISHKVLFTPDILLFALQNHSSPEVVELLIRNGADLNSAASNGDTVLHLVIANYVEATCLELVNMFIKAGCDPATRGSQGDTVLEASIKRGYISVVGHLISRNVRIPPNILSFALQNHSPPRMVEHLVRTVVDVHSIMSNGDTALHLAVATYVGPACLELVKILIDAGCDPMARDSHGETVLEAAMKRGDVSVTEFLLPRNISFSYSFDILSQALQRSCNPLTIRWLARKCGDHLTGSHWDTLFQLAHTSYSGRDRQSVLLVLRVERMAESAYVRGGNRRR